MKELIDGIINAAALAAGGSDRLMITISVSGESVYAANVEGPNAEVPFVGCGATPAIAMRLLAGSIADALEKKGLELRARGNLHAEVVAQLRNVADASRGAQ